MNEILISSLKVFFKFDPVFNFSGTYHNDASSRCRSAILSLASS